jgi:starvation-inducible DNA-binding protein
MEFLMSDVQMIETAKVVMADTFRFYLKAHNYHWNVEGIHFAQFHELFSKIYEEVFDALDVIAEEIRAMDSHVPASFGRFAELSRISDEREVPEAIEMIRRLMIDNEQVLLNIKTAYDAAEAAGNHGFSNLLAERQTAHRKHGWMLKSTLRN